MHARTADVSMELCTKIAAVCHCLAARQLLLKEKCRQAAKQWHTTRDGFISGSTARSLFQGSLIDLFSKDL
jgi:hypothetical protein